MKYQQLFDTAYESFRHPNSSKRKAFARQVARRFETALIAPNPVAATRELGDELRPKLGARATTSLVRLALSLREVLPPAPWSPGNPPFISILTSATSLETALEIDKHLIGRGARTWLYKRIRVGRRIRGEDEHALVESDYVVLLVCRAALKSNFVEFELDIVHWLEMTEKRERLLPVIVDDLPFRELPPWLGSVEAISLTELGIGGVIKEIFARIGEDRHRREKGGGNNG